MRSRSIELDLTGNIVQVLDFVETNFVAFLFGNFNMGVNQKSGKQEIIEVALELAAHYKWGDVTLSQISKNAGISLSQLISLFPSKNALVVGIMEDNTKVVVNDTDQEIFSESPSDRLFDILLRRIEVLSPNKIAFKSIIKENLSSPVDVLCMAPKFFNQIRTTLEVVGIASTGISGRIRAHGVAAIYIGALFVWFQDESGDMGKTTAFLDRRLKAFKHLCETGIKGNSNNLN